MSGTNYYAANAGSSGNNGLTTLTPKDTVAHCLALMGAGDILNLNGGDTFHESNDLSFPVTITSYGSGKATVSGASVVSGFAAVATADILAETFDTVSGYDNTGWAPSVGSGSVVDPDNTDIMGPLDTVIGNWTTSGGQLLKCQKVSPNYNAADRWDHTTAMPIVYAQVYVYVAAFGGSGGQNVRLLELIDGTGSSEAIVSATYSDASHWKLRSQVFFNGTNTDVSDSTVHTYADGWHLIQVKFDATNKLYSVTMDGAAPLDSGSLTGTVSAGTRYIRLGDNVRSATATLYFDNLFASTTGFTPTTVANVYGVALATQARTAAVNAALAIMGSSPNALTNGQWFWQSGQFFLRSDSGNPDTLGSVVEAGQRANAFTGYSLGSTTISNLIVKLTNNAAIPFTNGTGSTVSGCDFYWTSGWWKGGVNGCVQFDTMTGGGVSGCTFTDNLNDGIFCLRGSGYILSYNTITRCLRTGSDGIQVSDYGGVSAKNFTISYNVIDQTGSDTNKGCILTEGVSGDPISGATIIWNTCTSGNWSCYLGAGDGAAKSSLVSHNLFQNSLINGLVIDDGGVGAAIDGNTISFNVILNTAQNGISGNPTGALTNLNIYHNVIANSGQRNVYLGLNASVSGNFKNNILGAFGGASNPAHANYQVVNVGTWVSDYNCFYPNYANCFAWTTTPNQYSTLAAFQAGASQDAHSIATDPLFASVSLGGFRLKSGSPCRNAGVVIAGVNNGYYGSAPDMGAFEFIESLRIALRPWRPLRPFR